MKLIFYTDTHLKGVNPINRIDDYRTSVITKIKEIHQIAKSKKVDCIIHGGDVFDTALISNNILDEFVDIIEETNIPEYIVPGNHDMIGHNWSLSKGTATAHIFRRSNLIKNLYTIETDEVFIEGYPYYHNIEEDIAKNGLYAMTNNRDVKKIAIVHALITKNSLPAQAMHVITSKIKTDYDIVLIAHNHYGEGIVEINNTKFINIGCIGRTGTDEAHVVPSVVYIDTQKDELEIINLKFGKPKEEIFDLEKAKEIKKYEGEIDNFIKSLENVKFQSLDLRGIIENIAKKDKIERQVIDEVIERIGELEND